MRVDLNTIINAKLCYAEEYAPDKNAFHDYLQTVRLREAVARAVITYTAHRIQSNFPSQIKKRGTAASHITMRGKTLDCKLGYSTMQKSLSSSSVSFASNVPNRCSSSILSASY